MNDETIYLYALSQVKKVLDARVAELDQQLQQGSDEQQQLIEEQQKLNEMLKTRISILEKKF